MKHSLKFLTVLGGGVDILMMLILPIHEHLHASTYLYLPQFLSSVFYNFPSTGLLYPFPIYNYQDTEAAQVSISR